MKHILILLMSLSFLVFSCDEIPDPVKDVIVTVVTDTTDTTDIPQLRKKRVLLMEFTGIRCANCPDAARVAAKIFKNYGDDVIGLNVHPIVGNFANKLNGTDFRSKVSEEIYALSGVSSLPAGFVNRLGPSEESLNKGAFETAVIEALKDSADMEIVLEVVKKSENLFELKVDMELFEEMSENTFLAAFLIEDNIIGSQLDGQDVITDYIHNHVVRKSIIADVGESIFDPNLKVGDTFSKSYAFSFVKEKELSWAKENMKIICFAYDYAGTWEFMQVSEVHLLDNSNDDVE